MTFQTRPWADRFAEYCPPADNLTIEEPLSSDSAPTLEADDFEIVESPPAYPDGWSVMETIHKELDRRFARLERLTAPMNKADYKMMLGHRWEAGVEYPPKHGRVAALLVRDALTALHGAWWGTGIRDRLKDTQGHAEGLRALDVFTKTSIRWDLSKRSNFEAHETEPLNQVVRELRGRVFSAALARVGYSDGALLAYSGYGNEDSGPEELLVCRHVTGVKVKYPTLGLHALEPTGHPAEQRSPMYPKKLGYKAILFMQPHGAVNTLRTVGIRAPLPYAAALMLTR